MGSAPIRKRQSPVAAFAAWTNRNPIACLVAVIVFVALPFTLFLFRVEVREPGKSPRQATLSETIRYYSGTFNPRPASK